MKARYTVSEGFGDLNTMHSFPTQAEAQAFYDQCQCDPQRVVSMMVHFDGEMIAANEEYRRRFPWNVPNRTVPSCVECGANLPEPPNACDECCGADQADVRSSVRAILSSVNWASHESLAGSLELVAAVIGVPVKP